MRQRVLSLPQRLRYVLAWDHALSTGGAQSAPWGPRVVSRTDDEMDHLLETIERRLHRVLARRGLAVGDDGHADRGSEESPVPAEIAAASVQGRLALSAMTHGGPPRRN